MLRVWARHAAFGPGVVEHTAGVVKRLAHVDTVGDQRGTGLLDVGLDEDQAVSRARDPRRDALAEDDRARRAGRRHLHDPKVVPGNKVGIQPPAHHLIEALGPIDVGNGQDNDLEFHVHAPHLGVLGKVSLFTSMLLIFYLRRLGLVLVLRLQLGLLVAPV